MNFISKNACRVFFLIVAGQACANDKVTFQLGWLPGGEYAPVYVGLQMGLFEKAGLDVTVASGRGASDVVTKLATGTADIGIAGLAALMQAKASSEIPVKAVFSVHTKQPDALVTYEGSGINSLSDLKGKKIATATFSTSNVIWPILLKMNGLSDSDIKVTKVDPGALAPMLASGTSDAAISFTTGAAAYDGPLNSVGKKTKLIRWSDYGFNGYGMVIFATDDMMAKRPEVLKRFLKVYREAEELAVADPALAVNSVHVAAPMVETSTAEKQWRESIMLISNDISNKDGLGAIDPKRLALTWDWAAKSLGVPLDKIDPEKIVDRSFIPK